MHLSPLTGIETVFCLCVCVLCVVMHLSPLTGIETDLRCLNGIWDLMHLSPLTGIETDPFLHKS